MRIKEKDEKHIVIRVTRGGFMGVVGLVFPIIMITFALFIPYMPYKVIFALFGLFAIWLLLREFIGDTIILDKPTQTVTMRKPSLYLFTRQHIILFSQVSSVALDYEEGWHQEADYDLWRVSLNIGGGKSEITQASEEADMYTLAKEISTFIGKELVDNSAKPETPPGRLFRWVKGFFVRR